MGSAMSRAMWGAALLAIVAVGCPGPRPCGWDERLTLGAVYDVQLLELYTPASTTAAFRPGLELVRPAATCGTLDELEAGFEMAIRLTGGGPQPRSCSFWFADVVEPDLGLGDPLPILINNITHNVINASGMRDLGGGCRGLWELTVRAPEDDPFAAQQPDSPPVLVAYRVFESADNAECSALAGRTPTGDSFTCGDVFVATMAER